MDRHCLPDPPGPGTVPGASIACLSWAAYTTMGRAPMTLSSQHVFRRLTVICAHNCIKVGPLPAVLALVVGVGHIPSQQKAISSSNHQWSFSRFFFLYRSNQTSASHIGYSLSGCLLLSLAHAGFQNRTYSPKSIQYLVK